MEDDRVMIQELKIQMEYIKKTLEKISNNLEELVSWKNEQEKILLKQENRITLLESACEEQKLKTSEMENVLEKLKALLPAARLVGGVGAFSVIIALVYFLLKFTGKISW